MTLHKKKAHNRERGHREAWEIENFLKAVFLLYFKTLSKPTLFLNIKNVKYQNHKGMIQREKYIQHFCRKMKISKKKSVFQ